MSQSSTYSIFLTAVVTSLLQRWAHLHLTRKHRIDRCYVELLHGDHRTCSTELYPGTVQPKESSNSWCSETVAGAETVAPFNCLTGERRETHISIDGRRQYSTLSVSILGLIKQSRFKQHNFDQPYARKRNPQNTNVLILPMNTPCTEAIAKGQDAKTRTE